MVSGWHRRFQGMVGKHTPSFYYLLREVKKEQRDVDMMVMELELNRRVKVPQRHKYAAVTQRLHEAALEYETYRAEGRILDYLRRCGYNFTL